MECTENTLFPKLADQYLLFGFVFFEHFFQHFYINVAYLFKVKTTHTGFKFSKFFQLRGKVFEAETEINCHVLFPWRKACDKPIALTTTFAFVMKSTKTNNTASPHSRFFFGCLFHQVKQCETIVS